MRAILLLLTLASSQAAEIETITLADGRVLVGELTPKGLHGATVALVKPKATITISMDDVKERAPWHEPQLTVYAPGTEPAPKVPRPAHKAAVGVSRLAEIDAALVPLAKSRDELNAAMGKLEQERTAIMTKADRDFIATGDISTIPLSLPANPSPEDERKMQRAQELNMRLREIGQIRAFWKSTGAQGNYGAQLRDGFWEMYTEFKGGSAPY